MELQFLGTGAAAPTSERNTSALAIRPAQCSDWLLFDCGEATQQQIMKSQVSLGKISHCFISHMHGDHWFGLPGLLNTRQLIGLEEPLQVYGPEGLADVMRAIYKASGSYADKLAISPWESGILVDQTTYQVSACPVSHDVPCMAFILQTPDLPGVFDVEKARAAGIPEGPLYGRLQQGELISWQGRDYAGEDFLGPVRKGLNVIISGDNDQPEALREKVAECDLWIHEATHTEVTMAAIKQKVSHSTAAAVARVAEEAGCPNLILTHLSPRFQDPAAICDEMQGYYSGNGFVAADFDRFHLHSDGLTLVSS